MALKNKDTSIVLIYCFLVVLTGVVTVEGEQGENQLKTEKLHNVHVESEDDSQTGIVTRNKRQNNKGDNEGQCNSCNLNVIRGRDGRDGRDGTKGITGPQGSKGPAGVKGDKGDRGSSGATYVRWGRSVCPPGAERIYSGIASGSKYNLGGGTDQTLCLPNDPEYFPGDTLTSHQGTLWGIRYEVFKSSASVPLNRRSALEMPCAVCYVNTMQVHHSHHPSKVHLSIWVDT